MKIGFYNPYLDCFGGGERYTLTLASHWSKKHGVTVFWDDSTILAESEKRFHLDLHRIQLESNIFESQNTLSKLMTTIRYDVIFFLSDGSVPFSLAKHTMYHFQVPFPTVQFPFWKRIKAHSIVCNSQFTADHIDPLIGKKAKIIYPPVAIDEFSIGKKEKIILNVGRFDSYWYAKKQDILIDIFQKGYFKGILKDWKLIFVGSMLETDKAYVEQLKKQAKGLPIEFLIDIPFSQLRSLYSRASVYWHAAGFGETDLQKMEHFGITTVEAMASGCIPIVYNAGGQPEIVGHGKNGYVWNTKEECLKYTTDVIHSEKLRSQFLSQSTITTNKYSSEVFCRKFDEILNTITKR